MIEILKKDDKEDVRVYLDEDIIIRRQKIKSLNIA
jgi:hypothetical protein